MELSFVQLLMYGGALAVMAVLIQWASAGKVMFRVAVDKVLEATKHSLDRAEKQVDDFIPLLRTMVEAQNDTNKGLRELKELIREYHQENRERMDRLEGQPKNPRAGPSKRGDNGGDNGDGNDPPFPNTLGRVG